MQQYNLQRFMDAQEKSYQVALSEVRNGRKQSHWMWYIFPQVQGLGLSSTSRYYALADLGEAGAFLQHPVLGQRLVEISTALLHLETNDAYRVFGSPDDIKLRSCMTLFSMLNKDQVFEKVLQKFFGGLQDDKTVRAIKNLNGG